MSQLTNKILPEPSRLDAIRERLNQHPQAISMGEAQFLKEQKESQDRLKEEARKLGEEFIKKNNTPTPGVGIEAASGMVTGAARVVRNIQDGVMTLLGNEPSRDPGRLILGITPASEITDSESLLDDTGKIAAAVTEFAAPVALSMGAGLGVKAGIGLDALYGFFAADPNAPRLSELLKGTAAEDVPLLAEMVERLPDDPEIENRVKNSIEAVGVGTAVVPVLWGAAKLYSALKSMGSRIYKAARGGGALPPPPPPPTAGAAAENIPAAQKASPTPVTPEEEAKLAAGEVKMSAQAISKADMDEASDILKEIAPESAVSSVVKAKEAPKIRFNLRGDFWNRFVYVVSKLPENTLQRLRAPTTDKETIEAAKIWLNDKKLPETLAKWEVGKALPDDQQAVAFKFALRQGVRQIGESADQLINKIAEGKTITKAQLVAFDRDLAGADAAVKILTGTASQTAARLRIERVLSNAAKMGDAEAIALIGGEGRARMMQGLVEKAGGRAALFDKAKRLQLLNDISDIKNMPDTDFVYRYGNVMQKTKWMRVEDAITSVALNGMLSSPVTWSKAVTGNFTTTMKSVVDNYVAVPMSGRNYSAALDEANAYAAGVFEGLWGALPFRPGRDIKYAQGADINLDFIQAQGTKSLGSASEQGLFLHYLESFAQSKSVQLPRKVLMGSDTFFQEANMRGVIYAESLAAATKRGLTGEARDAFIQAFRSNPPDSVMLKAREVAATNTLAKDLSETMQKAEDLLFNNPTTRQIPFNRVIIPFFKTAANMAEYSVMNSPFALVSPAFRRELLQSGRAGALARANLSTGILAMGTVAYLVNAGVVRGRSSNYGQDRALKNPTKGAQDTAIKIGDSWVSVKGLGPIASLIDASAYLSKISGHLSEDEYSEVIQGVVASFFETTTVEQLTGSMSDIMDAIAGRKPISDFLSEQPEKFIPFGGALKEVREYVDPTQREVKTLGPVGFDRFMDTVGNRILNKIPGLSDKLPPQRNIFGQLVPVIDGLGPDFISPVAWADESKPNFKRVFEKLAEHAMRFEGEDGVRQLTITRPSDIIFGEKLTPEEYDKLILFSAGFDAEGNRMIDPETRQPIPTLLEAMGKHIKGTNLATPEPTNLDLEKYKIVQGELSKTLLEYRRRGTEYMKMYEPFRQRVKRSK